MPHNKAKQHRPFGAGPRYARPLLAALGVSPLTAERPDEGEKGDLVFKGGTRRTMRGPAERRRGERQVRRNRRRLKQEEATGGKRREGQSGRGCR